MISYKKNVSKTSLFFRHIFYLCLLQINRLLLISFYWFYRFAKIKLLFKIIYKLKLIRLLVFEFWCQRPWEKSFREKRVFKVLGTVFSNLEPWCKYTGKTFLWMRSRSSNGRPWTNQKFAPNVKTNMAVIIIWQNTFE